jgi:hypothetical protein
MSIQKKFPLGFWLENDVTPLNVLAGMLNEMCTPIAGIEGLSELLLKGDLSEEIQVEIKAIQENAAYLRSIREAGFEYMRMNKSLEGSS